MTFIEEAKDYLEWRNRPLRHEEGGLLVEERQVPGKRAAVFVYSVPSSVNGRLAKAYMVNHDTVRGMNSFEMPRPSPTPEIKITYVRLEPARVVVGLNGQDYWFVSDRIAAE